MNSRRTLSTAAMAAAAFATSVALAAFQPDEHSATVAVAPRLSADVVERAAQTFSDAGISMGVNTALAKGDQLSAMRIDVNTVDGHVVLDGSAPDTAASQRAAQLARDIDGVKSVDNRLSRFSR